MYVGETKKYAKHTPPIYTLIHSFTHLHPRHTGSFQPHFMQII